MPWQRTSPRSSLWSRPSELIARVAREPGTQLSSRPARCFPGIATTSRAVPAEQPVGSRTESCLPSPAEDRLPSFGLGPTIWSCPLSCSALPPCCSTPWWARGWRWSPGGTLRESSSSESTAAASSRETSQQRSGSADTSPGDSEAASWPPRSGCSSGRSRGERQLERAARHRRIACAAANRVCRSRCARVPS
jgi:hypothetical protein